MKRVYRVYALKNVAQFMVRSLIGYEQRRRYAYGGVMEDVEAGEDNESDDGDEADEATAEEDGG